MGGGAAGSFLTGFSNGFSRQRDRKAMQERDDRFFQDRQAERDLRWAELGSGDGSREYGGGGRDSGRGSARMSVPDPANTSLTAYQRAFLNSIASGESNGAYNVRYSPNGGQTFDLSGGHPRIYEDGPAGKSSAAGRYQFTWTTWKDVAGEDTPFTPENQDKYAWALASRDYHRRTGRNLDTDLQERGMTDDVMEALRPTWTSLGGNRGAVAETYRSSMDRYQPKPEPAEQIASAGLSYGSRGLSIGGASPVDYLLGKMK